MKLKIYEENQKPEERPIYLKLFYEEPDMIILGVCDRNGNLFFRGALLTITPDGLLYRQHSVDSGLGFCLNSSGQIEEADD